MKYLLPFLAVGLILMSSCSSSRKTAQTPDDVYYSPGSGNAVAAASSSDEDGGYYSPRNSRTGSNGEYYSTAPSDNYVRMKAQDEARWSYFDDYNAYDSYYSPAAVSPYYSMGFGYGYPLYGSYYGMGYGMGLGFGDPYFAWNSYFMWNSCYNPYFYNPYYGGGVIVAKGSSYNNNVYTHLRAFNGTSYRNGLVTRVTNTNNRVYRPAPTAYSRELQSRGSGNRISTGYSNGNNGYYRSSSSYPSSNSGYSTRPSSSNSGSFSSQPVRTYSAPSAPSGGGGGGGGSARPVRH